MFTRRPAYASCFNLFKYEYNTIVDIKAATAAVEALDLAAAAVAEGDGSVGGAGALDVWRRERWYGTRFKLTAIGSSDLLRWSDVPALAAAASKQQPPLRLPEENPFVPTEFSIVAPLRALTDPPVAHPPPPPTKLGGGPTGVALWYKLDKI
ncbi:hypothetical protein T492DRAFT_842348 [Pavlovales sp. CCMP2436]|nr:hypothetical protein T492DRAFT_842348 [Pavlovales sp. CCMP2436]